MTIEFDKDELVIIKRLIEREIFDINQHTAWDDIRECDEAIDGASKEMDYLEKISYKIKQVLVEEYQKWLEQPKETKEELIDDLVKDCSESFKQFDETYWWLNEKMRNSRCYSDAFSRLMITRHDLNRLRNKAKAIKECE